MNFEKPAFADRSERGKLRVAGPQRAWFLDQILTQSFEDIAPGDARDTAMLTVHGRMIAYLEALATEEAILCHYEPELAGVVPEALGRYLLATDATMTDATDEFGLLLIVSDEWRALAAEHAPKGRPHETSSLGISAGYVWLARDEVERVAASLDATGIRRAAEDELEVVRIDNAIARWGREMDTKTFPQEAAIDERAVQFEKGCYLGQEAMAKIHYRGKVNRRLARIESESPLEAGAEITVDGKRIGSVTSAANGRGLAIVRYDVPEGTAVKIGDRDAMIVG